KIAEQGYAVDNEEMDVGVCCVGAPIRDYTRRIIGAVSISGPSMRFSVERMEKELIPLVIKAGEDISTKLGFHK
ncbi:MAG TPA: IclR family transcriptional regulator C-terminal domain-containing protein, partial [Geobacteraceae bacterium]|nr:IclR family transcriptional regulator C-terminal domain-containing protein [Geobacteraceae bacterium]